MVGQVWQAGEEVAEVCVGIDVPAAAAFDDGINDRTALANSRFADEEPVLFSNGGWPDGIFHEVVVDLDAAVPEVNFQGAPLAQGVINGLSEEALWQMESARFEEEQCFVESM